MIIPSLGIWTSASGRWFVRERIHWYSNWNLARRLLHIFGTSGWTPLVRIRWRYR